MSWFEDDRLIVLDMAWNDRSGAAVSESGEDWPLELFAVEDAAEPLVELGQRVAARAVEQGAALVFVSEVQCRALVRNGLDGPRAALQHYCYAAVCATELSRLTVRYRDALRAVEVATVPPEVRQIVREALASS